MSGLAPCLPRVFSVGPGSRVTYGTEVTAATSRAASTPIPAISNVAVLCCMSRSLRTVHPLAVTAGEDLVLPDRHARLQLLDQRAAGTERGIAVIGGGRHHDGQVTHREVAGPVQHGQPAKLMAGRHLLCNPLKLGQRGGVGAVGKRRYPLAAIMITHGADEDGGRPGRRVLDGG